MAIDELFPKECLACQLEGDWLCAACNQSCVAIKALACPFCDRLSGLGKTCPRCRAMYKLTGALSLWRYAPPVSDFIHGLKYHRISAAEQKVRAQLSALVSQLPITPSRPTIITSVPLAPQRLAQRGYNQSEILAQGISRMSGWPYRRLLIRKAGTVSQTRLRRAERLKNVAQQFRLLHPRLWLAKYQVIIVDDVLTTGATLGGVANKLYEAGPRQIWAITLARD